MEFSKEQKWTLWLLRICTVLYAISYPFIFQLSLMSFMLADKPNIKPIIFYSIVIPCLSVPIFMLIGIWKMWANYVKTKYAKALWYAALPVGVCLLVILLISLIDKMCH